MRAALILNPGAREGDRAPAELVTLLAGYGVDAYLIPVGDAGIAPAVRTALADAPEAVVVGGGDGTLSSAAEVLCGSAVPLGILPLGTANDFARTIGLPAELDAACAVIGAGQTLTVDIGVANGRHCLNVASL